MTQKEKVLEKLKQDGYVDNFWAIENYVLRLGALIYQFSKEEKQFRRVFGNSFPLTQYEKKLSQGDVAKTLGVHRSYISGLERGVRNPSLVTIQKVAKVLGVSADKLIK